MEKHYHYLVCYSFQSANKSFGFGDMGIETANKISNILINELRKKVLESAKEHDNKIDGISIISISPLGCGCEDEEN